MWLQKEVGFKLQTNPTHKAEPEKKPAKGVYPAGVETEFSTFVQDLFCCSLPAAAAAAPAAGAVESPKHKSRQKPQTPKAKTRTPGNSS